jgi:membrane protease subunit (stomatin/prohibitin family)
MSYRKTIISGTLLLATALGASIPAQSDNSGAFIGGMFASRIMTNMHQRTEAEQQQAYNSQPQAQQPVQQAAPAQKTPQQRLNELDKLAAGGYITPAEYKAKKQDIINSM